MWRALAAAVIAGTVAAALASAQPPTAPQLSALALRGYPAGMAAPVFTVETLDGGTLSMAGLRGQVVLLNFWATWCLECRSEMPDLERLQRRFAADGLAVIAINVRESRETVRRFADELGLTFRLGLDSGGRVQVTYGVVAVPSTILIGRDGHAVALAVGVRDWNGPVAEAILRTLLAGPRPERDR